MSFKETLLALMWGIASAGPAIAGDLLGPGVISTGLQETSAAFSPDGNTLYFMRSDFSEADDTILASHRDGDGWSTPRVASFSGRWHDSEPSFAPDGRRLYFVSNRPVRPGGEPITMEFAGHEYPGKNLWYVEKRGNGWGAPVHVDGALNDGGMIYNPSVTKSGDIYFSAHREDSGRQFQIYVARRRGEAFDTPERLELGSIEHNRMDPAVDPGGRFLVYAGNEGDSLGRADIYIVFRQPDGSWGKPERLPGNINSRVLENAPALGRGFGELYVSSARRDEVGFPKARDSFESLQERLRSPLNGSRNIWLFDISGLLRSHGVNP